MDRSRLYITFAIILMSSFLIINIQNEPVKATGWWNTSWDYYKDITLTNATNDAQIFLFVYQNNGNDDITNFKVDCEGHCENDFRDIRFIDASHSSQLYAYMSRSVAGSYAQFWIKLPSDIEDTKKIVMYYGNNGATATYNTRVAGNNTFDFFDDFTTDPTSNPEYSFTGTYSYSALNDYIELGDPTSDTSGYMYLDLTHSKVYSSTKTIIKVWEERYPCGTQGYNNDRTDHTGGYIDSTHKHWMSWSTQDTPLFTFVKRIATSTWYYDSESEQIDYDAEWHNWVTSIGRYYSSFWKFKWTYLEPYETNGVPSDTTSQAFTDIVFGTTRGRVRISEIGLLTYTTSQPKWTLLGNEVAQPPIIVNPIPINGTTNIVEHENTHKVHCSIVVAGLDTPPADIYWYENTTGAWKQQQTNLTITDGTYHWDYVNATDFNTTYYWKVSVDDGTTNQTEIFQFTTRESIIVNLTINIGKTSANVQGYLKYTEDPTSVGFWIADEPVNETNNDYNYTIAVGQTSDTEFSKSLTLTSSEYYYVKAWRSNSDGFWVSTETDYFLTKPNAPTDLTVTNYNCTNISLSWTNSSPPAGTNRTTVIVYDTDTYPTTISGGTIGYNGTATFTTVEGLSPDERYYFSAFTYINASGSPYWWWVSSSYATASSTTFSGNITLTFRWECNQTLVINSSADYMNSILTAEAIDGEILYYNNSLLTNPTTINTSRLPDIIRFNYDNLNMTRSIIPVRGTVNYTIYVCCYPEWDGISTNYSDYQIFYTLSFDDYTMNNVFARANDTQVNIYKYNTTAQLVIHQDYWSAEDTVKIALHYGERYFIGVENDESTIDFIQYIDPLTDTSLEIVIIPEEANVYSIFDYVYVNTSSVIGGAWVNYTDTRYDTDNVNITFYLIYPNNDTMIAVFWYNFSANEEDYFWALADNFNYNNTYMLVFNIVHGQFDENQTYVAGILPSYFEHFVDNIDWINNLINTYLFVIPVNMTWVNLICFILIFTSMLVVGRKSPSVAFILGGFMTILLYGLVFNQGSIFTFGAVLFGIALILLGIIFFRGDMIK